MNRPIVSIGVSALLVLSNFSINAAAQANTLAQAVEKCRKLEDSLQRLVCYDRISMPTAKQGVNAPKGKSSPKPAPKAADMLESAQLSPHNSSADEADFGREGKAQRERQADTMTVNIVNVSENVRGEKTITFDNASVWRQVDNSNLRLKKGQKVIIERGLFGAFYLKVDGLNQTMKVKRIK
jgi:hypothetical protein